MPFMWNAAQDFLCMVIAASTWHFFLSSLNVIYVASLGFTKSSEDAFLHGETEAEMP